MAIRLTEKSRTLVELPLLLFLRLADADGKMTAREMERFDALIEKPQWCRSSLLGQALANTRAEKAALWKRYAAGDFRASIDRAAADLDTVFGAAPAEERSPRARPLIFLRPNSKSRARRGRACRRPGRDPGERLAARPDHAALGARGGASERQPGAAGA